MGRWVRKVRLGEVVYVVLLVVVAVLPVVIFVADRVFFHVRDGAGCLCQSSSSKSLVEGQEVIEFETKVPCMATKVAMVAGITYRFEVEVSSSWYDGSIPAGPDGLKKATPLIMRFATPLRRHIFRPWFELMGRVGQTGRETFAIGAGTCYAAKSDGQLYLYVNDAVSGLLPGKWWSFSYFWSWGPNSGRALVSVTAIGQS